MPTLPNEQIERWALTLLEPGRRHLNLDPAEGAFLRDLARRVNARKALEIGTSNGFSGLWIAMAMRENDGRLVTVEADPGRHTIALESFRATGLAGFVEARLGDALDVVPSVEGPLDLAFLDAVKTDYLKYLELVLPKMRAGGVVVAHNVVSHPQEMVDFLERIQTDPALKTEFASPGKQGFSVSWVNEGSAGAPRV